MGKIVVFICALLGLAVVSLLVLAINIKLNMKPNDQKAFVVLTRFDLSNRMKKTAGLIIYKFFKIVRYHRRRELADHSRLLMQLKSLCEQLQRDLRFYRSRKNPNISEDMLRCFEDFKMAQQNARFSISLAGKMVSEDINSMPFKIPEIQTLSEILGLPLESEEFKLFQKELLRKRSKPDESMTEESETLRRDKTKLMLFKGIDERKVTILRPSNLCDLENSFSDPGIHTIRNTVTLKQKF